ncbi:hypothetical protein V8E36_008625 [Tilletia maclaganii]
MSSIPYGPTAGFTGSQAITVADSQTSVEASQGSDSTTPASHREDADMYDLGDDEEFIDDGTQPSDPSQTTVPTLSQELAGLTPPGSISDARLHRLPEGAYREAASYDEEESLVNWSDEEWDAQQAALKAQADEASHTPDASGVDYNEPFSSSTLAGDTTPTPTSGLAASIHAPADDDMETASVVNNPGGTESAPDGNHGEEAGSSAPAAHDDTPSRGPKHYLDAMSVQRIARQGYPHPKWNVVHTLSEAGNNPPNGQVCVDLPSWVNVNKAHHAFALQGAALEAAGEIIKSCAAPRDVQATLHGGRNPRLFVSFATGECTMAAAALRVVVPAIDNHPSFVLDGFMVGAELGARFVCLHFRHPGMSPAVVQKKFNALVNAAPDLYSVEQWVVFHHTGPPLAPKSPTNTFVAILVFKPPMGGNYATPLTEDELRSAPLWVDRFATTFPGRVPAFRGCRGTATARGDFHTSSNCTNPLIPCALCNKWGHTAVLCLTNHNHHHNNKNNDHDDFPGPGGDGGDNGNDDDASDGPFGGNSHAGAAVHPSSSARFNYIPAGPAPTSAYPEVRPSTSAPVIPVANPSSSAHGADVDEGPSNPFGGFRGGSQGSRGRGRGRGSGTPNRTRYQQCYITPQGVVSRAPPAGVSPTSSNSSSSCPRKQQKRGRSPHDEGSNDRNNNNK